MTTAFKLAVRKLFSKAYGIPYVAAISTIKTQFPVFDPKNEVHWYNLIDRCNERLTELEMTPHDHMEMIAKRLQEKGLVKTSESSFLGYSMTFSYKRVNCGTIGYSNTMNRYYYSIGRYGGERYTDSAKAAMVGFLSINKYNMAA